MDPYRVLFPLGVFAAILGTVPWVTFGFGLSNFYPGLFHPDLMMGGFLFAFSAGFLMTAIPQFTGSAVCRTWELFLSAAIFVALVAASFFEYRFWFHVLSCFSLISLVMFCIRRVLSRTNSPPRFFIFVGLGLLMGIVGSGLLALCDLGWLVGGAWFGLAKLIYTQGMVLSLILGVGTHLLPAIWGWAELPIKASKVDVSESVLKVIGPVFVLAFVLASSFIVEVKWSAVAGWVMRAILVTFLSVNHWHILRKPKARGRLAFWLWISAWALLIGLWAPVLAPAYWVHGIHIAFIGGFGLMTLMVASRVTLAHGGYGHRVELRSRLLPAAAIIILLSAFTRGLAPLVPQAYLHHLAYAAGTWIIGVLTWSFVFIPKMIRLGPKSSPHTH